MPPGGYFGKALVVDLDVPSSEPLALDEETLRGCIGGAGLGTHLMHALAPAGVDPLAPEAPLAFVFSPLVGTPLTTSAKFAVVAKSPLTDRLDDALAPSHFAIAGKLTGHDAIVVRGACERPSALVVDEHGARLVDAAGLWGLPADATEARMRERLGPAYRVAAIGPAGERLVRFAPVSHDGRHAGPGGLGAVMGAKALKAVAVRAARKCAVANPGAVLVASKDLRARSFGPAIAKYRGLGTLTNLLAFNALSALPGRNFGTETTTLSLEQRAAVRDSCASCSVGCERILTTNDGRFARVEYEAELDRLDGGVARVAAAIESEDRAAAMDSLILCKFLRGVFAEPWEEWAGLLRPVTGWDIDGDELHETARAIVGAKHAFNRRESAEDTLPLL